MAKGEREVASKAKRTEGEKVLRHVLYPCKWKRRKKGKERREGKGETKLQQS